MKCTVSLRPQRVTVRRKGFLHSARWRQRGGNDGELFEIEGNKWLLHAVLTAWTGQREFEITDEQLGEQGGGWWTPTDPGDQEAG